MAKFRQFMQGLPLKHGNLVGHWKNLKKSCPNPEWRRDLTRAYMRLRIADGTVDDFTRVVMALPPVGKPTEEWMPAWKVKGLVRRLP